MWTVVKLIAGLIRDWIVLAARVRTIIENDLDHAAAEREEIRGLLFEQRDLLKEQIGYCRGLREAGSCPPSAAVHP